MLPRMDDADIVLLPWEQEAAGLVTRVWTPQQPIPDQALLDHVVLYVPDYLGGEDAMALMRRMPRLRIVQSLWAGVDAVWPHLPERVALHNAQGVHDASTAELAVGLMLARLRGLDDAARDMVDQRWAPQRRRALADSHVLLAGYGGVGQAVERRLAGFDVTITRVGRSTRIQDGRLVRSMKDLPDLLPAADVVVLALPLAADTTGLVDERFLGRMRRGALLVNVSRGAVVDTEALVDALQAGRIHAALDVTEPEPLPPDHPLFSLPNCIVLPHIAARTYGGLQRMYAVVDDVIAFLRR